MELKDTLVTGATVLAVGTSSVVGGNQVMDKVNIDSRIQQLIPTTTGAVVPTTKAPQLDYRNNVPQR